MMGNITYNINMGSYRKGKERGSGKAAKFTYSYGLVNCKQNYCSDCRIKCNRKMKFNLSKMPNAKCNSVCLFERFLCAVLLTQREGLRISLDIDSIRFDGMVY